MIVFSPELWEKHSQTPPVKQILKHKDNRYIQMDTISCTSRPLLQNWKTHARNHSIPII